jgi:hypothetical protein
LPSALDRFNSGVAVVQKAVRFVAAAISGMKRLGMVVLNQRWFPSENHLFML